MGTNCCKTRVTLSLNSQLNKNEISSTPKILSSITDKTNDQQQQNLENFLIIWLDSNLNDNEILDNRQTKLQLRSIINYIKIFTNIDECKNFMKNIKDEKIFFIVSGTLGEIIIPQIHLLEQLHKVYIFCSHIPIHQQWTKDYYKIHGVYDTIQPICDQLKKHLSLSTHNMIEITTLPITNTGEINRQEISFMYAQISKEIFLSMNYTDDDKQEMIELCRSQYHDNTLEQKKIDEFDKNYKSDQAIFYYTLDSCVYRLLNKALRIQDIDTLYKMKFFIKDLHLQLNQLYSSQFLSKAKTRTETVYRGQSMLKEEFEKKLKNNINGLLSISTFLSTTIDKNVASIYAITNEPNCEGILFQINIDLSNNYSSSFADIAQLSQFKDENEILFSIGSVFRIKSVDQSNDNNIWNVILILTDDEDLQLKMLKNQIKEEIETHVALCNLAQLTIEMGKFDQGKKFFQTAIQKTDQSNTEELVTAYIGLGNVCRLKGEYSYALEHLQEALRLQLECLSSNKEETANIYNVLGLTCSRLGQSDNALNYLQKAIEAIGNSNSDDDIVTLSRINHSMAQNYQSKGNYHLASKTYEKALHFQFHVLPTVHPQYAVLYNDIGSNYALQGKYTKALHYFNKALEIYQQSLPDEHSEYANTYNNIGIVYTKQGKYAQALEFYNKALKIRLNCFGSDHPVVGSIYMNIGVVYQKQGYYQQAFDNFHITLNIYQKVFSENNNMFGQLYNHIGLNYHHQGNDIDALMYYEKALINFSNEPNHPFIGTICHNFGLSFIASNNYEEAYRYYQKSLEHYTCSLTNDNHPDFALVYNSIGEYCDIKENYDEGLKYYEKCLKTYSDNLNHPIVATFYNNIAMNYYNQKEFEKASVYSKKSIDIVQTTLPLNHPNVILYEKNFKMIQTKRQ